MGSGLVNKEGSLRHLFVISDLHLGGRPHNNVMDSEDRPSQINSSYQQLANFIDWLASGKACEGETELVLNGDTVDFLMDDDYGENVFPRPWTDNEDEVICKLEKIVERTREGSVSGPFDAIKEFLATGHTLTLILGNHDVELSLPMVRQRLMALLDARRKNLNFIYDGEAYVRGTLLIEHGNRYDRFNITDHSGLRQERSAMSRGLPLHASRRDSGRFAPCAGSILVTEILNRIKDRYRFLDLLKPDTGAAFPLLLALHPRLEHVLSQLLALSKVSTRWTASGMLNPAEPHRDNLLGAENADATLTLSELLRQELGGDANLFELTRVDSGRLGAADMLENLRKLAGRISCYLFDQSNFFSTWRTEDSRRKQLLAALRALRNDRSFHLDYESPEYLDAAKILARSRRFSTIVFGHTHLPKQLEIPNEGSSRVQYINTGTWADLIRVPKEILSDVDATRAGT